MLLSEALTKYVAWSKFQNRDKTSKNYENNLRQFCLYMHNCEIGGVSLDDVLSFYQMLTDLGVDKSSVSAKSCAIKQFFNFFYKLKEKVMNPDLIPVVKTRRKFPKLIEPKDVEKILNSIGNREIHDVRDRLCVMMLRDTGMRVGELLSLDVTQVDTERMEALIQTEKTTGEEHRTVFWTSQTNKVLVEYLKMRDGLLKSNGYEDSGALLITIWGFQTGKRMTMSSLEQQFRKMSHKAKLGFCCNPHRFRHSFGRKLALGNNEDGEGGANAHVIAQMMGHKEISSSKPYTEMNDTMRRNVYTKFFRR